MAVMMKCGHAANATKEGGKPCCVICIGINSGADLVDETPPSLDGRNAVCDYFDCMKKVPSDFNLPFFEYRGPGSEVAEKACGICNIWHKGKDAPKHTKPHDWKPKLFETDRYYCGCKGWD